MIWCLIFLVVVASVPALQGGTAEPNGLVTQSAPVVPDVFEGDVRDLPAPSPWKQGEPVGDIPRRQYPRPPSAAPTPREPSPDPLLEAQEKAGVVALEDLAFTTPSRNFPGQGYTGANPPDTVGDVGPNHYIQMVNRGSANWGALVAIYDKAEPVPNLLASFALETLGSGACASGLGDPIVLYDRPADRWLLTEFAEFGNHLCVYVSRTPDPVSGGWFAYDFATPEFPDYPKYAIWPTDRNGGAGSFVVTTNENLPTLYALDRGRMLAGQPSTSLRATLPALPGFPFQALTPADPDGRDAPPAGSPAIFMRHRDTEVHSGPPAPGDLLEMWSWNIDWVTPASSTLTQLSSIDVAEFDSDLCGLSSFSCFPQPGTTVRLDPLREVIMNRLQYLNFGTHETLVGSYVTDVSGTDHGGVRWFELRRQGGGWALQQEGTWSIDSNNRWMSSIAMDQSGNIAVGYNVSSSTTYPSLRYTGRLASDPPGVMSQPESTIHAGTASNSSVRYGDYAAMSLDPVDDCTFWFTGEDNTAPTWRTQIASFRFEACGCAPLPGPTLLSPGSGATGIPIAPVLDWSDLSGAATYDVQVSTDPGFATIAASATGLTASTWTVSPPLSPSTRYYWRARAVAACGPGDWSLVFDFTTCATPAPVLVAPADGSVLSTTSPALDWIDVPGAASYSVQVSASPAFTSIIRSVSGLTASTWTVSPALANGVTYYWRVRATGPCGTGAWSGGRSFQLGCAAPATAAYDAILRAPGCAASACGCSSGTLLDSRDNIAGRSEPNQPNTLGGSCTDGTSGSYHSLTAGESVDRIVVRSTDGDRLRPGGQAQVDVTVWCRGTILPVQNGSMQEQTPGDGEIVRSARAPEQVSYVDLYYASNASAPTWTVVATGIQCPGAGDSTLSRTFTLANVTGTHALRAKVRYLGTNAPCSPGGYIDHDDLGFRVEPAPPDPLPLEAGYAHSVSVNSDGTVWGWGLNQSGQLGDGTTTDRNGPVRAGALTNVVSVAAGVFHTVALRTDGTVWTWGGNADGQLGDGSTVPYRTVPGQVPGLSGVVAIAAGANHTLAADGNGMVWAWGDNWQGQLGDGTTQDRRNPVPVGGGLSNVVALGAGFYHSVAVRRDRTVWTWGRNSEGELGDGGHTNRPLPGQVPSLQRVRKVGCGAYFNLALLEDGTIRGWGHNFYGQLGDGSQIERPSPVAVPDFGNVTAVSPGSGFSLVLRSDGTVWSFGQNVAGQLGDGTFSNRSVPGPVIGGLSNVAALAAGEDHSLARTVPGLIYGWGKNRYGQIGAAPDPQPTPLFITDQSVTPPLALMYPTGGELWLPGATETVSWTGGGPIHIDMSITGSAPWSLAHPTTSLQDVPITVPPWTTAKGRLRIVRDGVPASQAQTAAFMKIAPPARYPWLTQTVDATPEVTGEFAAIGLDQSGRTHMAYFDRTNGALKYARRVGTSWGIETVDPDYSNGWYLSLAFAPDDTPRIAYFDGTRAMVRYAWRTGTTWSVEDVTGSGCTDKTTLAIDSLGRPHIAFADCHLGTRIRYMLKIDGDWVDVTPLYQGNYLAGRNPSLRLDAQDLPRLSYVRGFIGPTTELRYASATSGPSGWTWTDAPIAADGANANSLRLDAQGNPWITWHAQATGTLRLAKKIGTAPWALETVDGTGGDVGDQNSLAFNTQGRPCVSYHANGLLKLAEWSGTQWLYDAVDLSGDTGRFSSLAVDPAGNLRIAYYDGLNGNLKYAISQPDVTAPAAPVLQGASGRTTAAVGWSDVGDDDQTGTAWTYEVRYSQQPLYDYNFFQGTLVPSGGGCASVQDLNSCSPYYFAVMAIDDVGNESPVTTIMIITDCSGSLEVIC